MPILPQDFNRGHNLDIDLGLTIAFLDTLMPIQYTEDDDDFTMIRILELI